MPEHALQPLYTSERVVVQLFRLFRLARMHDLGNEAVARALEEAQSLLREGCGEADGDLHILFTPEAVFVCGQLLRASRTGYDLAMELGQRLLELGVNMISVTREVTVDDLREVMARFSAFDAAGGTGERPSAGGFALRRVDATIRLDDEESLAGQLVTTYSYAVVGMRRLFEEIKEGRYVFTRFVKRVLQRLIQLSDRAPEVFTGLVSYRTAHNDESGRAVNAAVIAIAMGRNLTRDYGFLSRLGMAAMLFDAGLPRAAGMGFPDPDRLTAAIPRLTRDQRRTVPASNALVQIALSRMHGEAESRTVIGYESNWLAARKLLPPLYAGDFEPALEALLVATVYRFIQLTTFDVWVEKTATIDDAIYTLRGEARTDVERALVELLVGTLGIFPRGTAVELNTGWRGVVERLAKPSEGFRRSQVLLLLDPSGAPCPKTSIDLLADERFGVIERRLAEPGELLTAAAREIVALARLARATGETAPSGAGAPARTPTPRETPTPPTSAARSSSGAAEVVLVDGVLSEVGAAPEPLAPSSTPPAQHPPAGDEPPPAQRPSTPDRLAAAVRAAEANTLSEAPPEAAQVLAQSHTEPDATPAAGVLNPPRRHLRVPDRTPVPLRAVPSARLSEDTPESLGDAAAVAVLGADYQRVGSGSSIAVHSGSFHAVRTSELERVPSGTGFRALGPPRVSTAIRAALDRSGARLMESDPAPHVSVGPTAASAQPRPAQQAQPRPAQQAQQARTAHPPRAAVMKRRKTQDVAAISTTRAEDTSPDLAPAPNGPDSWGGDTTPAPAWDALPLPRVPLEDFAAGAEGELDPPLVPREEPEPGRSAPSRELSGARPVVKSQPLPSAARRASRDLPAVGARVVPRSNRGVSPD